MRGSYWSRNVSTSLTSIPIILCCFCSGLIDSCVFNAWGVFATMQTGNDPLILIFRSELTYINNREHRHSRARRFPTTKGPPQSLASSISSHPFLLSRQSVYCSRNKSPASTPPYHSYLVVPPPNSAHHYGRRPCSVAHCSRHNS